MFIHPHMISSDLVRDLDAQLNRLGAVAHVAVGETDTSALVVIGQGFPAPFPRNHPTLSSFVEADLIAASLNALQGVGDRQRVAILRSMTGAGGH